MKTYFKTIVGSKLYGVSTPESDTDMRGFGMPDPKFIIGLARQEEDISKNLESNSECAIFSVGKYLSLLIKGNPTVFEIAFAGSEFHVIRTEQSNKILEFVQKTFVTKHLFKPYSAYFRAQMKDSFNKERQGKRLELVNKFGYDVKAASHTARLGYQCVELMATGFLNPTLQGKEREYVFALKTGQVPKRDAIQLLELIDKDMYAAYSKSALPSSVNYNIVNKFCMDIYYDYLTECYIKE